MVPAGVRNATVPPPGIGATVAVSVTATPAVGLADAVTEVVVAVVAAADGIPSVILSLAGGVLADRMPRRRILLVTQSMLGLSAGALALLVATHHATFVTILVVAIVFGATDAADLPTRQALVADLVERHLVVNAVALGAAAMSATRIVGPSVAGLLIGFAGPAVCFGFLAVAYLAPIVVLLRVIPDIAPLPRLAGNTAWGELVSGLRAAGSDPLVRSIPVALDEAGRVGGAAQLPSRTRRSLAGIWRASASNNASPSSAMAVFSAWRTPKSPQPGHQSGSV